MCYLSFQHVLFCKDYTKFRGLHAHYMYMYLGNVFRQVGEQLEVLASTCTCCFQEARESRLQRRHILGRLLM
jgi:hypothetical protein